jgi:hypothetical protein
MCHNCTRKRERSRLQAPVSPESASRPVGGEAMAVMRRQALKPRRVCLKCHRKFPAGQLDALRWCRKCAAEQKARWKSGESRESVGAA